MTLFTKIEASPNEILQTSWNNYKAEIIDPDGGVRRRDQGNDVVSEGIAYTMLRAVWINDQDTFDKVYNFAEQKMSRKNKADLGDNLLAWQYQGNAVSDWGAASDADEDYALALAFADKKWGTPKLGGLESYRNKSIAVQKDILRLETGWIGDKVYLQPGTWHAFKAPIPVNPSYLAPGHYKVFDKMSPDPRWDKLVESSYDVLWKSSGSIDGQIGMGLPPDWVQVNENGSVSKSPNLGIDYKYDAFRTSMRVAMDYAWTGDMRAKNYLTVSGARNFLLSTLTSNGKIVAEYRHDGTPMSEDANAGTYAVNVGWFMPENQDKVDEFKVKMEDEYNKNNRKFMAGTNYYMENLAWIGYALATGNTPDIYGGQQSAGGAPAQLTSRSELSVVTPVINSLTSPSLSPESSLQPSAQPNPPAVQVDTDQWLQIKNPSDNQNLSGKFTMTIKNTMPNNQGTWWSVDSGSWIDLNNVGNNEWSGEINISEWNWKQDQNYTLHGWTKDSNGNQVHTQITIHKQ
ncbi:MAG: glycosyl hydrolase family 8 [bacterium]|nr:glycosyl hydrolase family 8 [bacterium]